MRTLLFHDLKSEQKRIQTLSEFPIQKFERFCQQLKKRHIRTTSITEESTSNAIQILFDDGFKSNLKAAKILNSYSQKATFFLTTAHLQNDKAVNIYGNAEYLTATDIEHLVTLGMDIGSHTTHHLDLRLLSEEDLRSELLDSKRILEEITKRPITSLSIPYGLWDDRVIQYAGSCGYERVVVYNFTQKASQYSTVIPCYGVSSLDTVEDIFDKIEGRSTLVSARTTLIPHFAKGSPLAVFHSRYRRLPLPWFTNRKERNEAN